VDNYLQFLVDDPHIRSNRQSAVAESRFPVAIQVQKDLRVLVGNGLRHLQQEKYMRLVAGQSGLAQEKLVFRWVLRVFTNTLEPKGVPRVNGLGQVRHELVLVPQRIMGGSGVQDGPSEDLESGRSRWKVGNIIWSAQGERNPLCMTRLRRCRCRHKGKGEARDGGGREATAKGRDPKKDRFSHLQISLRGFPAFLLRGKRATRRGKHHVGETPQPFGKK
jgi:hypothetical protein